MWSGICCQTRFMLSEQCRRCLAAAEQYTMSYAHFLTCIHPMIVQGGSPISRTLSEKSELFTEFVSSGPMAASIG